MLSKYPAIAVYTNPKIIAIVFLGFVSGLPLALTTSTLAIWMREEGISLKSIGLFALVGTPYVIKFLWSPLIDHLKLPFFTSAFGHRRGWLIFIQILLIISIILLGGTNPVDNLWNVAFFALLVSTFSATQDIVIDAYRIEILDADKQGAGAAAVVFGWRIGALVSGAGALYLAVFLGWFATYFVMAGFILLGMVVVLVSEEPGGRTEIYSYGWMGWIKTAVIEPFGEFMSRSGWWVILVFIILYKLGDAYAGVMTAPFVIDMGFEKQEYAKIVKLYGFIAGIVGGFIGGSIVYRWGVIKSLWISGVFMMLSNLMFVWQANVGYEPELLTLTIVVENLSGWMGNVVIVAYLSNLCNVKYTATQYALFSALAAAGRTWLSSSSGYVAESVGWANFFLASTAIAIPGLILLIWVGNNYNKEEKP